MPCITRNAGSSLATPEESTTSSVSNIQTPNGKAAHEAKIFSPSTTISTIATSTIPSDASIATLSDQTLTTDATQKRKIDNFQTSLHEMVQELTNLWYFSPDEDEEMTRLETEINYLQTTIQFEEKILERMKRKISPDFLVSEEGKAYLEENGIGGICELERRQAKKWEIEERDRQFDFSEEMEGFLEAERIWENGRWWWGPEFRFMAMIVFE